MLKAMHRLLLATDLEVDSMYITVLGKAASMPNTVSNIAGHVQVAWQVQWQETDHAVASELHDIALWPGLALLRLLHTTN